MHTKPKKMMQRTSAIIPTRVNKFCMKRYRSGVEKFEIQVCLPLILLAISMAFHLVFPYLTITKTTHMDYGEIIHNSDAKGFFVCLFNVCICTAMFTCLGYTKEDTKQKVVLKIDKILSEIYELQKRYFILLLNIPFS